MYVHIDSPCTPSVFSLLLTSTALARTGLMELVKTGLMELAKTALMELVRTGLMETRSYQYTPLGAVFSLLVFPCLQPSLPS